MRSGARFLWVFALWVLHVVGCNEVTTASTAPLTLTVTAVPVSGEDRERLKGVQLCEAGTTNCAMTDDKGNATLQLPIGQESSYTLEKEGWASYLVPKVIQANGEQSEFEMSAEQFFVEQYERLMSRWPMSGTGTVALSRASAGTTYELFGATGTAYYVHEFGDWRLDLASTTGRGSGGFVEVGPGDFQINLGGTANNCIVGDRGWPGSDANSVRFPVREGYVTVANVSCALPPTVQFLERIQEAVPGSIMRHGPPLEGVEVCETDTSNCVTTDANGEARLSLPANQEISVTLTKDGYVPYLIRNVTSNKSDIGAKRAMISNAQMADISEDLMIPYPWTGGWVYLRAWSNLSEVGILEGITYDLVDETAKQYYVDEDGYPTLGLTATTKWGVGGFLEVTPGEHQFDYGGTATNCRPGASWPADAANRIKVRARTGYITYGSWVGCEEPPLQ